MQFLYRAPIGLLQTSLDGGILLINPTAARHMMPLAVAGNLSNLFDVLDPVLPDLRARAAAASSEPGTVLCEDLRFTLPGTGRGGEPPLTLALSLQRLDAELLMGSLSDVTVAVVHERRRIQTELHDAARIDVLTGLPNRLALLELVETRRATASGNGRFALLYINVDRFSAVNVAHGVQIGDRLLCSISDRLNRLLRPNDAIARAGGPMAARLGGDEFVVLIDALPGAVEAMGVARRLIESLARPFGIEDLRLQVGVSVGIALSGADSDNDAQALLQNARIAMREAKHGDNTHLTVFENSMKERAAARGSLEQDLRRAIERDEIQVAWQPIVRLEDNQGVGFEALARWHHPRRGMVSPTEFIPVAEDCGLIAAMGARVLEIACTQFARWRREWGNNAPSVLSVNLSRAQLAEPVLVEQVASLLRTTGLPPEQLQLEITESMAGQEAMLQQRLPGLKGLGVMLALDDFGTGYSSLACLHQMPVDVVKIDRSFVCQSETSDHHRVLIDATVRVARSLGMSTVAEGIETTGQAQILKSLGCEKGQGYLFARPLTVVDAMQWWVRQLDHKSGTAQVC
jgi:diguanylate cyclase (GGDEF)-like protein